jgi:hypothetical protein
MKVAMNSTILSKFVRINKNAQCLPIIKKELSILSDQIGEKFENFIWKRLLGHPVFTGLDFSLLIVKTASVYLVSIKNYSKNS